MFEKIKSIFTKDASGYSVTTDLFNSKNSSGGSTGYLSSYKLNLYVNKAMNVRANKVGQTKFYLFNPVTEEVIKDHESLKILNKPNEYHTKTEFWSLAQKMKDVYGTCYIWLVRDREDPFQDKKSVKKMYVLQTGSVKEIYSKVSGELEMYEYTKPDNEKVLVLPMDMLVFRHVDLSSPLKGVSMMESGMREILTGSQLADYQAKILKNGGKVDGVFNFKNSEKLTESQLIKIKKKYKEDYAAASKAGIPLFMAGEADYKRVSLSPEELNYLESRKANLNDVCILTGVPKILLANVDDIKYSNADVSYRMFLRETIKPEVDNQIDKINENKGLIPEELDLISVDVVPEDVEEILKKNENGISNYYITPNEARANIGLEPIDGGDELYIPFNMMANSGVREEEPEEKPEEKKQKGNRPVFIHPLKDKGIREIYAKFLNKKFRQQRDRFKSVYDEFLKGQEKRITDRLVNLKMFKKKDLIDDIWNEGLEIELSIDAIMPVMEETLREAGVGAIDLLQSDHDFNISPQIAGWLDQKSNVFAEQTTATTFKKLKSEFTASLDAGETREKLVARISGIFVGISKGRAEVMARTEVHAASQKGQYEAYLQMNVPIKIWVWSPGIKGGVRDEHQAMDGEERPMNVPFSNGLMMPGEGPASEVVNCECTI